LIQARVAERGSAELLAQLAAAGVPASPVNDVGQVADHEQTAALGLIQDGPEATVALPLSFDGTRALHRAPPPRLGEHTAEILKRPDTAMDEIDALVREGIVRDGRLET
jgi:crotonobetainyl-CoA:carnitine CoA-transferase CaiB-like acyl-CoA transferase